MNVNNNEISKNNTAWAHLFDKYKILDHINRHGSFEITATQINEFREARLMTKFDHSINLPKLFSDNKLAILPITRGNYIIAQFKAYKEFEQQDKQIIPVTFPDYIESIDYENITSEAMAVNCAFVSNIMADFLEEEELWPTVSGRMSSDVFSFNITNVLTNSNMSINVVNSQLEIDAGFEGTKQLAIVEAKNFISDDFLIRQLYYPYRLWSKKISKVITPVFLVFTNGIFSLYKYEFIEPDNYNSLVLVKQKNYSIETTEITLDDLILVSRSTRYIEEPEIAFPQANNFRRIINLCELLAQDTMTKDDITLNYAFDPRQTNYYTDAGRYLGLIEKHQKNGQIFFSLTDEGQKIVRSKYKTRQLKFVETILKHKVFAETFNLYLQKGETPSRDEVMSIMRECNLYHVVSEQTFYRRASTITSWVNWIFDLQN